MTPDYFSIAINLIEQRDTNVLGSTLLQLFNKHFPDVQTTIYEAYADNNKIVRLFGSTTLITLRDNTLLRESLEKQRVVESSVNNMSCHSIFPVRGVARTKQLIEIRSGRSIPEQKDFFNKVIQLYSRVYFNMDKQDHDSLTGLLNRTAFDDRLPKILDHENHRRHFHSDRLCFALVDIDHFKDINDSFGHLYGDEVLILMAALMERGFRYHDLVFRYGGEEFAVLLTDVDLEVALNALQRFRQTVSDYQFPQLQTVTVSVGLTAIKNNQLLTNVIDRADQALYFAKENGRNRVCVFEELAAHGHLYEKPNQGAVELFYDQTATE